MVRCSYRSLGSNGTALSVTVFVKRPNDKPAVGAEVAIKWKGGGHSAGRTGSDGTYDTGASAGTAEYIMVDGKEVRQNVWLDESTTHELKTHRY